MTKVANKEPINLNPIAVENPQRALGKSRREGVDLERKAGRNINSSSSIAFRNNYYTRSLIYKNYEIITLSLSNDKIIIL